MDRAWLLENTAVTPLELLTAGRWWIVLAASLLVTLSFFPLRRLLGARLAVLAILFVAWMPFAVALSRQLHPDSMVSSLIFAALVFFLAWLYTGYRWRDLIVSGVMMGLAWLTKTPAAFLVPTGALLIGLELWRGHREATQDRTNSAADDEQTAHPAGWRSLLLGYVIWGVVASTTFFLLWPAMWVDPLGTFARMAAEMEEYVGGHINPNYFWGRTTDDPGPFFYPVAYLFRSTPATLVGLIAALFLGWQRRAPFDRPLVRRTAWAFALFALVFVGLMTIPAKKFDRYILPAFLALDVVAALGWVGLAHRALILFAAGRGRLADAHSRLHRRGAAAIVLAALLLTHALFTLTNYPYYLTYFNPLFGGSMSAPKVLLVGWGEGLDQVGRWLNQQPDGANKRVVSWYHDGPLSYYFDGEANGISYDSPLAWLDTDYVVLYINQVQRAIPSVDSVDFFLSQPSAFVADIDGLELAYVYDMSTTPLPPFTGLNTSAAAAFGDQLRLIAHDLSENEAAPGDTVLLTLHLQSIAPMSINYNILVRLVGPDGTELWREEGWPWGAPTRDWPVREVRSDGHEIQVPLGH